MVVLERLLEKHQIEETTRANDIKALINELRHESREEATARAEDYSKLFQRISALEGIRHEVDGLSSRVTVLERRSNGMSSDQYNRKSDKRLTLGEFFGQAATRALELLVVGTIITITLLAFGVRLGMPVQQAASAAASGGAHP
jgi:hypothetical protein